jgi:dihydroorotase
LVILFDQKINKTNNYPFTILANNWVFWHNKNMSTILTLPLADDLHVHLRQDEMLEFTIAETIRGGAGRVMVMPNLKPPVGTTDEAIMYLNELVAVRNKLGNHDLEFIMSLYLNPKLNKEELTKAKAAGINNVKMYPLGVTTNSESGVNDIRQFYPTFEVMQELDMIFNIHGEVPSNEEENICVMNAEISFLPILEQVNKDFPSLRIILEHVTTKEAVELIKKLPSNVAATITVHHLDSTVDSWAGQIHNFCKPVAKYPVDKQALIEAVRSGSPKFFLGSDSAPHKKEMKETACGCAGVYTASYMMAYLADILERNNCLDRIKDFSCTFGADFYKIPYQTKTFQLKKDSNIIEPIINGVVPFRAGQKIGWKIV